MSEDIFGCHDPWGRGAGEGVCYWDLTCSQGRCYDAQHPTEQRTAPQQRIICSKMSTGPKSRTLLYMVSWVSTLRVRRLARCHMHMVSFKAGI